MQFNFAVQIFQLPAGTKGLNTWEQLGCCSINQGDPGVSIPAVLCCPEAKSSRDFLYSFLILSVSVTDSAGSTAEERNRNGSVAVLGELQGWEPQGCWGDRKGGWALPQEPSADPPDPFTWCIWGSDVINSSTYRGAHLAKRLGCNQGSFHN